MTVGQTGVAATITLENRNTTAHIAVVNGVCNTVDHRRAATTCPRAASRSSLRASSWRAGAARQRARIPGHHAGSTASGPPRHGVHRHDVRRSGRRPRGWTVRFTPQPAGVRVALPGTGAKCTIDFTLSVLKLPTGDQDESTPETSPCRLTQHTQFAGPFGMSATQHVRARQREHHDPARAAGDRGLRVAERHRGRCDHGHRERRADASTPSRAPRSTSGCIRPADPACAGTPLFTSPDVTLSASRAAARRRRVRAGATGTYRWSAELQRRRQQRAGHRRRQPTRWRPSLDRPAARPSLRRLLLRRHVQPRLTATGPRRRHPGQTAQGRCCRRAAGQDGDDRRQGRAEHHQRDTARRRHRRTGASRADRRTRRQRHDLRRRRQRRVRGGAGNDRLLGDAGNDLVVGDAGNDTCSAATATTASAGGAGNDRATAARAATSSTSGAGRRGSRPAPRRLGHRPHARRRRDRRHDRLRYRARPARR